MGYTHYYTILGPLEEHRFAEWAKDVSPIIAATKKQVKICGPGGTGLPDITSKSVSLNGSRAGDKWHESFNIDTYTEGWHFCKTARKPYDIVVAAALIRLAYHFPEGVGVDSDGTRAEWQDALELCQRLFGFAMLPFVPYDEEKEEESA